MSWLDRLRGRPPKGERGFYSTVAGKAEATETLKAKPDRYLQNIGDKTHGWRTKCDEFDKYYEDCPEVKSQILTLAGRSTGEGLFLSPRKETELARKAVDACNELNRDLGLDKQLYETVIPLAKYGTVLWEVADDPFAVQLIPLVGEYKPLTFRNFDVTRWEILAGGYSASPPNTLDEGRFAEFSWNKTNSSWPYGTSLLMGLASTIEIINHLVTALDGYMENNAWPCGLFQVGEEADRPTNDALSSIVSKIRNRTPGEQFATQYKIDYKVIGPAAGETRILADALNFLKDRLIDGTLVPPVSKQQQRTVASAEIMDDNTFQAIVIPMQRLLKRVLESQVYWPFLKTQDMSVQNVPSVSLVPPTKGRNADAQYFISLIGAGLITREAAARELGIKPEDIPTQADLLKAKVEPKSEEQRLAEMMEDNHLGR